MRNGLDFTFVDDLSRPSLGGVHLEGMVDAVAIVVLDIRSQHAAQMSFAKDNDVIQALTSYASVQSFRVRVLPRAPGSRKCIARGSWESSVC